MSLKTAIQSAITEAIEAGVFYEVTYLDNTPTTTDTILTPESIVVNEVSGVPSSSARQNARSGQLTMTGWVFEARVKFAREADAYYFLTEQLKRVGFSYQKQVRVSAIPSVQAAQPLRQGSHGGTELVINFTVNTRR